MQAKGTNVVELAVAGGVVALPPGLGPSVAAATEGKSVGKLTFSLALALPLGPNLVLQGGAFVSGEGGGQVVFAPSHQRLLMTAAQVDALGSALDGSQTLSFELARCGAYGAHLVRC